MKALLVLNTVTLLSAVYLAVLQPMRTDLDVRMRYVQLDRAGAINREVLANPAIFQPSYGFSDDVRNTVPRYIARPALDGQRFNAFFLVGLASINVAIVVFIRKHTDPKCHVHGAANADEPQTPRGG